MTALVSRRDVAAFATVGVLVGLLRVEQLADANVLWETRDGLTILSTGSLPRHDAWSWTVHGRSWTPNSWGWDVVLGAVHRATGSGGIAALDVVLNAILFAVLGVAAVGNGSGLRVALATVGAIGGAILMPWVIVRPQLVGYLFVCGAIPLARRVIAAQGRRLVGWLALAGVVEVVWVNLHLFAVIGPVLLVLACLGALLEGESGVSARGGIVRTVAAGVVTSAACALTPYGPIAASKAIAVHRDVGGVAVEWRPAGFATYSQFTAVLALIVAVFAALHAWRARRWSTIFVLALLAVGAATACRLAPALAVVALPGAAAWLSAHRLRGRLVLVPATVAVVIGLGALVTGVGNLGKFATADDSANLIRRLPQGCRTVNDYELGGALIFFRPDVLVSVDSRTDLYGRSRITANSALLDSSSAAAMRRLNQADVHCVIAPSSARLVRDLAKDAHGWRKLGSDGGRTLLVRP